ncbi:AzlD family protein [Commensalibacter nepenthis]|uniref:AzlD family protein n=1 Tax=Commensalibacter nepenthis TaxID=3043872 RepID=A0ABT6Q8W9_9PROT|nr:AzlD family protein [Commensalibacter sp. TBRC 10068]MDI2113249.1 AzlD family protein [Commensalibacter sp. TBRC 10068]
MHDSLINHHAFLTILCMGLVTYLTRISGYLLLRNKNYPRLIRVLEILPGCVMISLVAPIFVTGKLSDFIAAILTILTAMRFSFLVTLIVGIGSAGILRHFLPMVLH